MPERDFLDINEKTSKDNPVDFSEGDFFNPGRTRVNDFKRTANSVHRGNMGAEAAHDSFRVTPPLPSGGGESAAHVNVTDEKMVWVGAIFVFVVVLVFLIGFWLGKNTIRDITAGRTTYNQRMEERLEQKKVENQLANGMVSVSPDTVSVASASANVTPVVSVTPVTPVVPTTAPILPDRHEDSVTEAPRTVPARKAAVPESKVKLETKKEAALKKTVVAAVPAKKDAVAPAVEAKKGDYTLQVSAHTSMDKARFIEDQMRALGLSAYIVEATVNGITYYRVRVGRFAGKTEADAALAKVRASQYGKDSFLLNLD